MSRKSGIPSPSVSGQEAGAIENIIALKLASLVVKKSTLEANESDCHVKFSMFEPELATTSYTLPLFV